MYLTFRRLRPVGSSKIKHASASDLSLNPANAPQRRFRSIPFDQRTSQTNIYCKNGNAMKLQSVKIPQLFFERN
jgi:hypothetical protein